MASIGQPFDLAAKTQLQFVYIGDEEILLASSGKDVAVYSLDAKLLASYSVSPATTFTCKPYGTSECLYIGAEDTRCRLIGWTNGNRVSRNVKGKVLSTFVRGEQVHVLGSGWIASFSLDLNEEVWAQDFENKALSGQFFLSQDSFLSPHFPQSELLAFLLNPQQVVFFSVSSRRHVQTIELRSRCTTPHGFHPSGKLYGTKSGLKVFDVAHDSAESKISVEHTSFVPFRHHIAFTTGTETLLYDLIYSTVICAIKTPCMILDACARFMVCSTTSRVIAMSLDLSSPSLSSVIGKNGSTDRHVSQFTSIPPGRYKSVSHQIVLELKKNTTKSTEQIRAIESLDSGGFDEALLRIIRDTTTTEIVQEAFEISNKRGIWPSAAWAWALKHARFRAANIPTAVTSFHAHGQLLALLNQGKDLWPSQLVEAMLIGLRESEYSILERSLIELEKAPKGMVVPLLRQLSPDVLELLLTFCLSSSTCLTFSTRVLDATPTSALLSKVPTSELLSIEIEEIENTVALIATLSELSRKIDASATTEEGLLKFGNPSKAKTARARGWDKGLEVGSYTLEHIDMA